jgi:hypothetical protein
MIIATLGDPVAISSLAKRTEHIDGSVVQVFEALKLEPTPVKSYRKEALHQTSQASQN